MRPRTNGGLVFTTSKSETKRRFARKNRTATKKYIMTVLGKVIYITREQYESLKAVGYKVDIVEN